MPAEVPADGARQDAQAIAGLTARLLDPSQQVLPDMVTAPLRTGDATEAVRAPRVLALL